MYYMQRKQKKLLLLTADTWGMDRNVALSARIGTTRIQRKARSFRKSSRTPQTSFRGFRGKLSTCWYWQSNSPRWDISAVQRNTWIFQFTFATRGVIPPGWLESFHLVLLRYHIQPGLNSHKTKRDISSARTKLTSRCMCGILIN